jgi:hypothetical protein
MLETTQLICPDENLTAHFTILLKLVEDKKVHLMLKTDSQLSTLHQRPPKATFVVQALIVRRVSDRSLITNNLALSLSLSLCV